MEFKRPQGYELNSLIDLVYKRNQDPKTASLYCYQNREAITSEIHFLYEQNHPFLGAYQQNILCGIIYGFQVPNMTRIDVCGPFLLNQHDMDLSQSLLDAFQAMTKHSDLHFYFDQANQSLIHTLNRLHADFQGNEYLMRVIRPDQVDIMYHPNLLPIRKDEEPHFCDMLMQVFPTNYIDGETILEDENRQVLLLHKNDTVIGFAVIKQLTSGKALMEEIGLKEEHRGYGEGKRLVKHVLSLLFQTNQYVELIVDDDNLRARHLYASMGFEIIKENKHYILKNHD